MKVFKNGIVELDAYETASYWWIKRIKNMASEIKACETPVSKNHETFSKIFDYDKIKNAGYRKLYLYLAQKFREKLEDQNQFSIRTYAKQHGHAELVSWLSEVMGEDVPCLNIGEFGAKDLTITIIKEKGFPESAYVSEFLNGGYKTRLANQFKKNPVLCGKPREQKKENNQELGDN